MNIPLPDLPAATAHAVDTLRAASSVSEALAQRLAAEHYGLIAAVHRLDSERDQNFRLRSLSGREFVLKIASPTEDRAVTNLQTEALLHLAATEPDLPVPRIFPARNGMTELDVTLEDGSARVVRLLSFLPGTPMHAVTGSATLRRDLGRCAARLARGLSDFSHGGANHKLLWDLQHAAELRPLLDAVQAERRGLVEDALGRFEAHALPILAQLPTQPVHNDLNPHNIVVDPDSHVCVAGIIDFGDLTCTARANDLAIAAAYLVADSDDPLSPACEMIAAYHAVQPLVSAELGIFSDLIATRMAMTVVISSWRAARYPANRNYILRNHEAAWARLQRMAKLSRDQARAQIERACRGE
jgi:hydroxylysine kinase